MTVSSYMSTYTDEEGGWEKPENPKIDDWDGVLWHEKNGGKPKIRNRIDLNFDEKYYWEGIGKYYALNFVSPQSTDTITSIYLRTLYLKIYLRKTNKTK